MQVFYVSELSSESDDSDNESDGRRLEKAAKLAMEDAHRRACIESATLRSSSMANTPTSYAPSTLNQMSPTELENHHMLLEGRIAELNDELVNLLVRRDELKTEQDAVLADCEDLQALLTTLVKETTV